MRRVGHRLPFLAAVRFGVLHAGTPSPAAPGTRPSRFGSAEPGPGDGRARKVAEHLPFLAVVLATCAVAWLAGRESGPPR